MQQTVILEKELSVAQERLKKAIKALAPKHKGGEWEEYRSAHTAVIALERALASAKGEQYALPIEFPIQWDVGAPMPHIIANEHKAFLAFHVHVPDPNWDGTYVTVRQPREVGKLAVVEFTNCSSIKIGTPNDEVYAGHPLSGKGLEGYTAQVVKNSIWLKELEAINSVHPNYSPKSWLEKSHFVFWFHDSTFECVAKSYKVEAFEGAMPELLSKLCKQLLEL
jgi:hypothetical protein